ncbi:TULIP family P47-like protein [Achromobacter insuavis]|uniref:TULIP family P47-like protein n=2 Tax=Pseudomonadati TaxID=3379134 RepID=UPI0029D9DA8A|nr:TULIP family P47-like protein [Achromobacter sp.]MCG2602481.1 TULIP family P47-like protein [Achromobacter sp.]
MSIYPSICEFAPAGRDLNNATLGWDAVYAVRYSTLNQSLSATATPPPPWVQHGPLTVDGFVNEGMLQTASITDVRIARGGTGETMKWQLQVQAAGYASALPGVPSITTPFRLTVELSTQLRIVEDPASPGLLHVKAHTAQLDPAQPDVGYQPPEIRSITINAADIASSGLSAMQVNAIQLVILSILQNTLPPHYAVLFDATPLSSILTQAFAKEVDIPWLKPSLYRAAAKDLPLDPQDGILAVLMMTEEHSPDGIDVAVSALAFPTNPGVNAAVILKSALLARTTLLTQLNQELTNSAFGTMQELKDEPGVLANEKAISLAYRIDDDNGQATLIPTKAVAESNGVTFPASIAPGALRFEIANGAITVNMTEVRVKLEGNNTLVLSMRASFGLVVDPVTQEIDISLDGNPKIISHFESARESGWVVWAQYGAILGSIIIGEVGAFVLDKFQGMYATVSDKRMAIHLDDYFAALRQSENENRPVEIYIGLKRTMVVDYRPGEPGSVLQGERISTPLNPAYRKALKLNAAYPDGPAPTGPRPGQIELTGNPAQEHPQANPGNQGTQPNLGTLPNLITEPLNDSTLPLTGNQQEGRPRRLVKADGTPLKILRPNRARALVIEPPVPDHPAGVRDPLLDPHLPQGMNDPDEPLHAPRPQLQRYNRDQVLAQGNLQLKAEWLIADVLYLTRADPELRKDLIATCTQQVPKAHEAALQNALNNIANDDHIRNGEGTHLGKISHIPNLARSTYESTIKCLDSWLNSGKITAAEYQVIVQQFPEFTQEPDLAKGAGSRHAGGRASHIHVETRARFREDGHPAPMLLAQLDAAERAVMIERAGQAPIRGNAALNRALMRQIMLDDRRPAWLHLAGVVGYLSMLAIGYFGGNAFSNLMTPASKKQAESDRQASEKLTNAAAAQPSSIIFNAVTFPLMARHTTGGVIDPTVPLPSAVLKCAAVNGGLVLGVSIT